MFFEKHKLMDELGEGGPAGGGTAMDEVVDGKGTDATPEPDYEAINEELDKEFQELTAEPEGDDQADPEKPTEDAVVDDHSDDASGEPVDGDEPTFGDDLVDRARLYGIEGDSLAMFDSPEQLERTLFFMRNHLLSGEAPGQPAEQQQEDSQDEQPATTPTPTEQQVPSEGLTAKWDADFRREFEPELLEFYDGASNAISSLQKEVADLRELKSYFDQQQAKTITDRFYEAVDGLGGIFADIYGQGENLSREHEAKRDELLKKVAAVGGSQGLANKTLIHEMASAANHDAVRKSWLKEHTHAARRNASKRMIRSGKSRGNEAPVAEGQDAVEKEADELFKQMLSAQ